MSHTLMHKRIAPGTLVRVEQRVVQRDGQWRTTVEGEVISHDMERTGSWYAHGKKNKLWLARLRLKKADGEISALNLDCHTRMTILKPAS